MLTEEQDSFARDDNDIGMIQDFKLEINLEDKTPVQKNYIAVPCPPYPEVKSYTEDLLNRNFINKTKSPYSSPVVCVHKKNQTLRLYVDYRALILFYIVLLVEGLIKGAWTPQRLLDWQSEVG